MLIELTGSYQWGKGKGRGKIGIKIYKIGKQEVSIVQHRKI